MTASKNKLKMWAELHGCNVSEAARLLQLTRKTMHALLSGKREDILHSTAKHIEAETGLKPEDYLGLTK